MPTDISEMNLEDTLLRHLNEVHGYEVAMSNEYNKDYALWTERVKRFILATQEEKAQNTACFASPIEEAKVLHAPE